MKVLVIGATGYIGSRVIGSILAEGHEVIAGARKPLALDDFWWSESVDRVELDVLDEESVKKAITADLDAIVYLVHGMGGEDFAETDAKAANLVREAVDRVKINKIVYLSGIIPDVAEDELSQHLQSRLTVERELSQSTAAVITLRAAMIIGAGSTSFELMTQLSGRLPVTVIPDWMKTNVEPVAVVDVTRAIVGALASDKGTSHFDVGSGQTFPYPELIDKVAKARGEERPQVTIPLLPENLVAKIATFIADIPAPTVEALVESLQEDMVAKDTDWLTLLPPNSPGPVNFDEAVQRSLAPVDPLKRPSQRDPQGPLPGDPDWADSNETSH